MKKTLTLVLIFLLLPLYALAEGEGSTYSLSEIGVTLDVPSGYYVFTQQTKEGDPGVSELRINVEKWKASSLKKILLVM